MNEVRRVLQRGNLRIEMQLLALFVFIHRYSAHIRVSRLSQIRGQRFKVVE